jgi:hypothetical protein
MRGPRGSVVKMLVIERRGKIEQVTEILTLDGVDAYTVPTRAA